MLLSWTVQTREYSPLTRPQPPLTLFVVDSLLNSFSQQDFKVKELASVPVRDLGNAQQTENLTRWTQDATHNVTGHSESGLIMDVNDKERALEDLKVFKVRFPAVCTLHCPSRRVEGWQRRRD
jgi:hypothetical protein